MDKEVSSPNGVIETPDTLRKENVYSQNISQSTTGVDSKNLSPGALCQSIEEIKTHSEILSLKDQVSEIKNMLEGQERILMNFKNSIQVAKHENVKMADYLSSVDLTNLSISDSISKSINLMRSVDYGNMPAPNLSLIYRKDDNSFASSLMGLDSEIQSIEDESEIDNDSLEMTSIEVSFTQMVLARSHLLHLHI